MIRWILFVAYALGAFAFIMWALSEWFFGHGPTKEFLVRILLALIWPFAMMSAAGRYVLWTSTR